MAQINVDPKAQVLFARDLHVEVRQIHQRHEELGRHLLELRTSGVWADETQQEYQRSFDEATHDIDQLVRSAKSYCQYLEQQAALAERYLQLARRRI
jgi:uncharacterized protein YukE